MKSLPFQDFRLSTSSPGALARAIENPLKQFAASKIPQRKAGRITASVSYVDFLGKRHTIECSSKSQIVKARAFFDIFRVEHQRILNVIAEFPRTKAGGFTKATALAARKRLRTEFGMTVAVADWVIANA